MSTAKNDSTLFFHPDTASQPPNFQVSKRKNIFTSLYFVAIFFLLFFSNVLLYSCDHTESFMNSLNMHPKRVFCPKREIVNDFWNNGFLNY